MKLCALVGNGLSCAYSPDLAISALTREIVKAFKKLGGSEAGDALKALPRTLTGTTRDDFEALLSPFDFGAQAISQLAGMARLVPARQSGLAKSLKDVQNFLAATHALGLGLALEAIDTHARVNKGTHYRTTVVEFIQALLTRDFRRVDLFTPNYDNLIHSGLLELDAEMCDLADGRGRRKFKLAGEELDAWPIRATSGDMPRRRVRLVNLHGSLNWLSDQQTGRVWKFLIDDLRYLGPNAEGYWALLAHGKAGMLPAVVLTDRKREIVQQWPFSLAYELLSESFADSEAWVVAGYSFGDRAINGALRRAARSLANPPHVLVLGHGDVRDIQYDAQAALGVKPVLYVDGDGIPEAISGQAWKTWRKAVID